MKATVSKIIDSLIVAGGIKVQLDDQTPLGKDDLVELDGRTRITTASLAGKLFYIFRRVMQEPNIDFDKIGSEDPVVLEQLKAVYLRNELLPIPVLLEMTDTGLLQKAYVSVRADHFVDTASADRLEGEMRVLGTVSHLVAGGDDGYLSSEDWLLDGWEYLMRRRLMTDIDEVLQGLVEALDLDLPADDVQTYIKGPAIVLDAIALY